MNILFSPNHVHLCNACYPVSSALLSAGPDYSPNSQELSRLTYYASNHPGKLAKLGNELEKRVKADARKAAAGNMRARASLLITLNIFKALATECRRDLSLISPTLVSSLHIALYSLNSDLEVCAKAASVFMVWTTYTNGHLIGADSTMTNNYLSILSSFSSLASTDANPPDDQDTRNRTRLLGFAALAGALNSDALYNDTTQYRAQVSIVMRPILKTLLHAPVTLLDEQAISVKETPMSPYLAEFRTRPAIERRAASIHIHVDGDKGPCLSDVVNSCLQALNSLLRHATGGQLAHVMQALFQCVDEVAGWSQVEKCCWFARKTAELSQYQYRYAIPAALVKRLVEIQDVDQQVTLAAMVTAIFNSPTPQVNLSTSDIISSLISLLLHCVSTDSQGKLSTTIVECIASLGRHVYYSDQIQDLSAELISRINMIMSQGLPNSPTAESSRSEAILLLLDALIGLIQTAERHRELQHVQNSLDIRTDEALKIKIEIQNPSRSRVTPDTWMETLPLLGDEDSRVRSRYFSSLVYYLSKEIPNVADANAHSMKQRSDQFSLPTDASTKHLLREGDSGRRLLDAINARLFVLATSNLGRHTAEPEQSADVDMMIIPQLNVQPATPTGSPATENPQVHMKASQSPQTLAKPPRTRKASYRLSDKVPISIATSAIATPLDYSHLLEVLSTIQEQLPVTGVITGIPMLLALDKAACNYDSPQAHALKEVVFRAWLTIGRFWDSSEVIELANSCISSIASCSMLPRQTQKVEAVTGNEFPTELPNDAKTWLPFDSNAAISTLSASTKVQSATTLDRSALLKTFSRSWSPDSALNDSSESPTEGAADEVSPLLKISPALMHIENISLQSLARSVKGVGVNDLREALQGRSSMSNPTLVKPPSISTLDHTSMIGSDIAVNRLTPTASRTRSKNHPSVMTTGTGEVRDMLNRLGIGKQQNGSLLKSSFPVLQKQQRR